MLRNIAIGALLTTLLFAEAAAQAPSTFAVLPDAEIRKILTGRIGARPSVGIVVGVIEPRGRRVVAYGKPGNDDKHPLDGDTIFEIGSVTKVFTSLLLSDMVQRGEVALTDPVAKYLPARVKMPERGGRSITLEDLSTHTSGLPRLPTNLVLKNPANPYSDYSVEQLYDFLSHYQLTRDIGTQYEYSNVGGGLLGHVLAQRAGAGYEALVRSRICDPLAMNSTRITLPPALKALLAAGHNQAEEPTANWDFPTLGGAGGLRSSANDLPTFLAANLGYTKSPLAPAMAAMLRVRRPSGIPGLEIALGWHVFDRHGKEIIWHNGATGGYRSFIGFDRKSRTGVVVLSNSVSTGGEVDDIGQHLLDPQAPLKEPPKQHAETAVDPKLFDGYVGRYELKPNFVLMVTREGNQLFVQATGQPKLAVYAEGPKDYFYKAVDAQITFETDAQGRATGLVLHQNGMHIPARRVE